MLRTYDDAVAYLMGRINYERHPALADRQAFKLDRMRRLLARLGDPQERLPAVHIAGTKGKGSTAIMVASALTAAGYRTGLYTSPHLERFEERMQVDGEMPSPAEFLGIAVKVSEAVADLEREDESLAATYFEAATAMAWEFFSARGADIVVLEVGLGGRLDATNVCRPAVVAITNVSRDHTALLGETPAEIAFEKAGIVKSGVPCVSGVVDRDAAAVVQTVCRERDAPLLEVKGSYEIAEPSDAGERRRLLLKNPGELGARFTVPLSGQHQADNAAIALRLLAVLREQGWQIDAAMIEEGWKRLVWPARVEVVGRQPTIVLDAAHNWASAGVLASALRDDFRAKRTILLFAGSREKDVAGMLRRLAPFVDTAVFTAFHNNPRATLPAELQGLWRAITGRDAHVFEQSADGFAFCREIASEEDLICVTGSFFLAAEIRPLLRAVSGRRE